MTVPKLTCEAIARAALGPPLHNEGVELLFRCPHRERHRNGDVHPSFKVNPKKDTWGCFVCSVGGTAWQLAALLARRDPSDKPAVTAWLRDRVLLPARKGGGRAKSQHGECAAAYTYTDAAGNLVARKLRFEPGANGRTKDFAWERIEDGEWKPGLAGVELPLYRLREIAGAPLAVVTEGEKDADAGARIGLPTATSGGTGSFRAELADNLRGKDVVVIADADEPGRAEAQKRAVLLYGRAASLKLVEIPGAKDLAEAIEKGWTREKLLAFFVAAPEWRPADGAEILDAVVSFLLRFVAMTRDQARVVALWMAHTHAFAAADATPYLSVNSAEKQSGKTRLLEVLRLFVLNPWLTGRVTAAVLIRKIDAKKPSLLLDESDAAFGGEKEYAEALRGVLNTGYRRGGVASLCVGQGAAIEYKDFSTFCPKAIAGIGKLPDTVADRSIPIRLRRARRGEVVRFRERDAELDAAELQAKLAAWCGANIEMLRASRPEIPPELSDRQADVCEPLLAIADLVGGDWPKAARAALVELCAVAQAQDDSIGVRLLADVRAIFEEKKTDRLPSEELAGALTAIETSPWAEWSHGKPLTKQKLARLLKPFGIYPGSIRVEDRTPKGYLLADFADAFSRYLPTERRNNATSSISTGENATFQDATGKPCCDVKDAVSPNVDAAGCVVAAPIAGKRREHAQAEAMRTDPVADAVRSLLRPDEYIDERRRIRRVQ